MLANVTHILPITLIRRKRVLPITGKVLVRQGQKVGATDVIAEANLRPEHKLIDVARGLGLSAERADQNIQCKVGDQIAQGDVIAGPVGVPRRFVRAPQDGRVVLSGSGQVLLDITPKMVGLRAGIPGEITELIPDYGAVVETTGALIQGVWGNGRVDYGLMAVLVKEPYHVFTDNQIDVSLRGAIVLGGYCEDPEVLKTASELPLRGLIFATMNPSLIPLAKKLSLPVMVLDGFSERPMNSVAFKLLTTNARREVAVNAEPWDHEKGVRPELVIPLPAASNVIAPQESATFQVEQRVRVVRAPHAGEIGTIVQLTGEQKIATGLVAATAQVKLESEEAVILPLVNLEILS